MNTKHTDGTLSARLYIKNPANINENASIKIQYNANGNLTTYAPTPNNASNDANIATTAWVRQNALPTGAVIEWCLSAPPTGFLLCDGSAISRTTYAKLFAIIDTTYGEGDGSATFNLPTPQGGSTEYNNVTKMPSDGFVATKAGWCIIIANVNANSVTVTINGIIVWSISNNNYTVGSGSMIPVNKGDVIAVSGTAYSIKDLYFVPCRVSSCIKYI